MTVSEISEQKSASIQPVPWFLLVLAKTGKYPPLSFRDYFGTLQASRVLFKEPATADAAIPPFCGNILIMISLSRISIHFTGEDLFSDVSFIIADRDRIGLVGKNGAGKTTLLRIIAKILSPDKGDIVYSQDTTLGYLPQEMVTRTDRTVTEEARSAFSPLLELQANIQRMAEEIAVREDYETEHYLRLLHQYEEASQKFQLMGGHSIEGDTERVLAGLGFLAEDFGRPLSEFSSGWQMRVELAKILLQRPDVILLDEPTNHLDIEAITWLEDWIAAYRGALVLVSHDRAFLDNVTSRTIEISQGKIYDFKTGYSEYVVQRQEQIALQAASYENQQRQVAQIERFIERFRYKASKARQVQSRVKMLEKIDLIEVDDWDRSAIHFRFPPAPHSGKVVVEINRLTKKYGNKTVLDQVDFTLLKGEKVAFVGRNGEGKSTLSKIIAAGLDYEGEYKTGHNVSIGYYAQNQAELLDPDKTVFQTLDEIAKGDIRTRLKAILGSFLFSGEAIEKKVKVLSGGEKARLALARLLLEPVNLLVLDEPTNHLDMLSKDILKNALLDFTGSLILVSHDRDFLQELTTRVVEFRNHRLKEYIGDIYDFLAARKLSNLRQLEAPLPARAQGLQEDASANKLNYEKRKAIEKEKRKVLVRISRCESEIEKAETELREMDRKLATPDDYASEIQSKDFFDRYHYVKNKTERLMAEWEQMHAELEETGNSGNPDV